MSDHFRSEWIEEFRALVVEAAAAPYLYGDERYVRIPLSVAEAILEIVEVPSDD